MTENTANFIKQYAENGRAMDARMEAREKAVASVVVEYGQTIGQIATANEGATRSVVEDAVFGNYEVIGYRAGSEVYGNRK